MIRRTDNESFTTKAARLARHLARHPSSLPRWVRDRLTPGDPIARGLPWFSWAAIRWLDRWLQPSFTVHELGGGGSTLWFAQRVARVVTLESDARWLARLEGEIPHNVTLVHGASPSALPAEHADLIVIDSDLALRTGHVQWALRQRNAAVIVDDSWRYREFLPLDVTFFVGVGPCRLGVTETALYVPTAHHQMTP